MRKTPAKKTSDFEATPAAIMFMTYFAELGPRWGLAADTCRVHALLYLAAQPLTHEDIAAHCGLTKKRAAAAVEDLLNWRVATEDKKGVGIVGGEPIDLMFSALEERARREIPPALNMLKKKKKDTGDQPARSAEKMSDMLQLVEDLAALETQSGRFTSRPFSRLVKFGGRAARLMDLTFPRSRGRK